MNRKESLAMLKPAILFSVALDAEISDDLTKAIGDVLDEVYSMPNMRESTIVFDIANNFESIITTNKYLIAQLLLDTLKETKVAGPRFNKLYYLLSNYTKWDAYDKKLHSKIETLIRKNMQSYGL